MIGIDLVEKPSELRIVDDEACPRKCMSKLILVQLAIVVSINVFE